MEDEAVLKVFSTRRYTEVNKFCLQNAKFSYEKGYHSNRQAARVASVADRTVGFVNQRQ